MTTKRKTAALILILLLLCNLGFIWGNSLASKARVPGFEPERAPPAAGVPAGPHPR